jgi:hypothetical protein
LFGKHGQGLGHGIAAFFGEPNFEVVHFSGVRLGGGPLKEEEGTSRHKTSSPKMVTFLVTKKIFSELG